LAAEGHPTKVGSKFLLDLKDLVEKASRDNGGKPVIIVSHSLGGLFALQLLNKNPISWRKKYIQHFVALSTPWGGTVVQMVTFASGYTLGVPFVDPLLVREEQRTSESNTWLLPNAKVFGERKLVITPDATYSAHEITRFLNDIGFSRGVYPYTTRILPLMEQLIAPEVPITCIIGSDVRTPETLFYGENGFDEQPDVVYGDGDGTVNMASLLALEKLWAEEKHQPLKVIRIGGISHTSILQNDSALAEITGEIYSINSRVISSVL
jgi:lysophospholipase-3